MARIIDGITCCVGPTYAGYLTRSIDYWLGALNSITIVTTPTDTPTIELALNKLQQHPDKIKLVTTDLFTAYGAKFNKAAALCCAYGACDPKDWVLHFDSDILPPGKIPKVLANENLDDRCLYGAFRYLEGGGRIDESPLFPYGYFHLWHRSASQAFRWPLFDLHHPHAGNYDADFADLWERYYRKELQLRLVHCGTPRANWYGPEADPNAMLRLHTIGLARVRQRAAAGHDQLRIPLPKLLVTTDSDDGPTNVEIVRAASRFNPFDIKFINTYFNEYTPDPNRTFYDPKIVVSEFTPAEKLVQEFSECLGV